MELLSTMSKVNDTRSKVAPAENADDVPLRSENQMFCEDDFPHLNTHSMKIGETHSPGGAGPWRKNLFPETKPTRKLILRFIPPKTRDEKSIGLCQKSAIEGELAVLDLTLVDFFLGHRPPFSLVKRTLLRLWKLHGNVEIIQLLQGGFAFRFSELGDRDAILESDVVFVGGQPMFLRQWERSLHSGGILGLRRVPLWISLPGLPLHLWGEEALSTICSVFGNPLYTDSTTAMKSRLAFARICVEFMGDRPMLESISIEDEIGMCYEQKVNYDWKPPHCISCGVFGHVECGIKKEEKGKMPAVLETQKNEQVNNDETDNIVGKEQHQGMEEQLEEEGWMEVRVKKKSPIGPGNRGHPMTRPGGQGVSPASRVVSPSHWPVQSPSAEKVSQPAHCQNKKDFSNFETSSTHVSCPTPPFEISIPGGDQSRTKSSHVVAKKPLDHSVSEPAGSGSSAGHTPFPTKSASIARDLRLSQFGRMSRPNNPLVLPLSGGSKDGPEKSVSASFREGFGGNGADRLKEHGGKTDACLDNAERLEEKNEGLEESNEPIGGNSDMEEEDISENQNFGYKGGHLKNPLSLFDMELNFMENGIQDVGQATSSNMARRNNKKSVSGHGKAETQKPL